MALRLWVLAVALAAGVLYVVAGWPAQHRDNAEAWAAAVARDHQLQDDAFQSFRSRSDGEAVRALEAYLSYLETTRPLVDDWEPGLNPWLDAQALANERMLTAGRLASVFERTGALGQANALWDQALRYARASGRPDVSLASVREAVELSRPSASPDGAVH
jgi:hypothetical protein